MQILFVSTMCSKETYKSIFETRKIKLIDPSQKYFEQLIRGMTKNNNVKIQALSAIPVSYNTYSKQVIEPCEEVKDNINYHYIGFKNGRISRFYSQYFAIYKYTRNWIKNETRKGHRKSEIVIACDALSFHIAEPARRAAHREGIKTVAFLTDIPIYATNMKNKDNGYIRKLAISIYEKCALDTCRSYDGYVYIVDGMQEKIGIKNKPFITIEGSVDMDLQKRKKYNSYNNTKTIIYAGGIYKIFGVDRLVKAFQLLNFEDTELHLYGSGDYVQDLIQINQIDNRIKYMGISLNTEMLDIEKKATLLVNTRPTEDVFTKYSFPSKTLEYMSSGTPVLSTKLQGIPSDYWPYIYWISDDSIQGIASALERVLEMDNTTLYAKGYSAQNYVYLHKNNEVQGKKIYEFFKKILITD